MSQTGSSKRRARPREKRPASAPPVPHPEVGIIAIGRNEGARLVRCLDAVAGQVAHIVYVDSGSTDDSVAAARVRGCLVVELDTSIPFTAARARNEGLARLLDVAPDISLVQFIDGDCELDRGWLGAARAFLADHPDVGAVAGRRRERYPDASVYNRLTDMEWDTPVGEATVLGGDVLVRREAIERVGGYNSRMIAGEDPEMCYRLGKAGYRIFRLDAEMTLHDAAMTEFSQWWKRATRGGHAYAEGAAMHGGEPDRYNRRELRSILFWAGAVPTGAAVLALPTLGASVALAAAGYTALAHRIYRYRLGRGDAPRDSALYAAATTVGKFAELQGVRTYAMNRWVRRTQSTLIEYKGPQ